MSDALKNDANNEIQDYEFKPINKAASSEYSEKFDLPKFNDVIKSSKNFEETIKSERSHAKGTRFKIAPVVEDFRGLKDQEEREIAEMIENEVQARFEKIKEEGRLTGIEEGKKEGLEQIQVELKEKVEASLAAVVKSIEEVQSAQHEILLNQKKEVYVFIRNLTKWITLKELKGDGQYLERLLEKLILEIQTKNNLLIQVNEKYFDQMPEVVDLVEKKLGQLRNVRVEMDPEIEGKGIILESENGIINASLKQQFENFDRLFESVGITNEDLAGTDDE